MGRRELGKRNRRARQVIAEALEGRTLLSATAALYSSYGVEEGGATTLFDSGGAFSGAVSWEWDTNYDGSTFVPRLTGQTPIFSAAGLDGPSARTIALRVKDAQGTYSSIATSTLNIRNVAPVVSAQVPASAAAGTVTTLNVAVSDPGPDTISKWVINWGDATAAQTFAGSLPTLSHVYASAGSYTVAATVTDEDGAYTETLLGPGSVDPAFGVNGRLSAPYADATPASVNPVTEKILVQPDGKILQLTMLTPGAYGSGLHAVHRLTRYNANGTPDTTFGNAGEVVVDAGVETGVVYFASSTLALQSDGSILLGVNRFGINSIYRYTATGSADGTFGNAGRVDLSSNGGDFSSIAVQSDGRILVLQGGNLFRLTSIGALDHTFGSHSSGFANVYASTGAAVPSTIALAADGKILLGGDGLDGEYPDLVYTPNLMRFTANGANDGSLFDPNNGASGVVGIAWPDNANTTYDESAAFLQQPDGKLLWIATATRQISGQPAVTLPVVRRANSDGSPDITFGAGTGYVELPTGSQGVGAAVQADGKIAIAIWRTDVGIAAERLNADGTIDATFGAAGQAITASGAADRATAVAIASDGSLLLSGIEDGTVPVTFRLRSGQFNVLPTPPTATFSAAGAVNEGSTGTLRFTSVTGTGPFTYSYDFNNDGIFDVVGTASSVTVPATYLADGTRVQTTRGRVTAATGAIADYTTTITINNVSPTVLLGAMPVGAKEGTAVALTATATDPSSVDTAAGFSYQWTITRAGATVASATLSTGSYSFTPDDNGTYSVSVSATDKDGGKSALSTSSFTAASVAPTAVFAADLATVQSGQTTAARFSAQFDPSSADVAAGFKYSYDYNNDGVFEVTDSTAASATIPLSYLTGVASRIVRGRIKDKDGGFTDYTITIQVQYPPPTATFTGGSVTEGSSRAVTFSGAAAGLAPYNYSYDFDNDGTFEVTSSTSTSATIPASYFPDGPATRSVHGRISAADGQFSDYTTNITVNNAAPTATFTSATPVLNFPCVLSFTNPTDVSATDVAAGFNYSYDFDNDGTFEIVNSSSASVTMPASYLSSLGAHSIRGRITDKDGGFTDYPITLTVVALNIVANPATSYTVEEGGALTTLYDKVSTSNAAAIVNWEWDTNYTSGNFVPRLTGPNAVFFSVGLDGPSSRTIALRVTDALGNTAITTSSLLINNTAPAVSATPSGPVVAGSPATFLLSSADPGADTITKWVIDWGDGTTATTYAGNPSSVTHTFAAVGNYVSVASVYDDDGVYTQTILGPGSVDPSFATNGRLRDTSVANPILKRTMVQPDGKVLQGWTIDVNPYGAYFPAVYRLNRSNPDGSPDMTFGTGGAVTITSLEAPGSVSALTLNALELQPDGKILLTGHDPSSFLMRLTSSGEVDTTFGTSGRISLPSGGEIAVQSDGKIVAFFSSSIYRYTASGNLDTTFGTAGHAAIPMPSSPFGSSYGVGHLFVLPDDRIVATGSYFAGTSSNGSTYNYYAIVSQLTANGIADATFGTGGYVTNSVPGQLTTTLFTGAAVRLASGKYLLASFYTPSGQSSRLTGLFRFNASGTIDTTFGTSGCVTINSITQPGELAEQADGKLLITDQQAVMPFLVRLKPDGGFDTTFGSGGRASISGVGGTIPLNLAVTPDGGILIVTLDQTNSIGRGPATFKLRSTPFTVAVPAATATFSAPTSVAEGSTTAVLGFTNATGGGPYTYSYDFDNDGTFEITNSSAASATIPASLLADGPITRTVRGRVTGSTGSTDYTASIAVTNVVPTVTLDPIPTGKTELQSVTVSASATDPSTADAAAGFTFAWTITKGIATIATGAGNSFTFTPGDNGSYTVSVIATDKDGGHSPAVSSSLAISNVSPTATFTAPATITEGAIAAVSFTAPFDTAADLTAGLLYSYDFNNDGTFEITNSTSASATIPAPFVADGPLTRTVRGRIADKDGGFTDYTGTILITNIAPTVVLGGLPPSPVEGQPVTLTASVTDPSATDAAAGFSYLWNVVRQGDLPLTGTSATLTFTPPDNGDYTVTLVVTDKDGAAVTAAPALLTVGNSSPTATFNAPATVTEGATATVSFTVPIDGAADLAAGLLYSYDFDNDGTFEITNSTAATATIPAAFLADGPFTRRVRGRISDKDGGFTDYTSGIAVTNVAPTVTLDAIATGKTELQSVTVSASATDPSAADAAAGFTFAWTISKGAATIATGTGNSFTFTPGDNGTYAVSVTATDKDGGQSSAVSSALVISNVAPSATFSAPGTVSEGATAMVSFTAPVDGAADLTAGFLYSYDFDSDGTFEITNSTAATATIPASFLNDGPFTRTVGGRVTDKDGGFTDYTSSIAVTNVAPTVTLDAIATGKTELQTVTVSASATDPSEADAAAGFAFVWTISKGASTIATGSGNTFTFTPGDNGTYTISVTATDKDGGQSSAASSAMVISNVAPTATFNAPATITEGANAMVSFTTPIDGAADLAAGLLYSYDFNNDGTFEITNSTAATATIPASFLANGPFTRTVRGRVSDKDGGFTDYSSSIAVTNVAPTVTLDPIPTGKTELQSVTVSASATDPSAADAAAGFTFAWTITKGIATIASGAGNSFTFNPPDNGTYTVSVIATDKDGGHSSAVSSALVISNVAPGATFNSPATVTEGANAMVSFTTPIDGAADLTAGLLYSYDFNNDGTFEITNSTAATATIPASFLADGPFTRTVRGRVADRDGGFTDYTGTILVTNVAPNVVLGGLPSAPVEGQPVMLTASVTDPSATDTAAGFSYAWSVLRDGNTFVTGHSATLSFTPPDNGEYTVNLVVSDKDEAAGTAAPMVLSVANAAPRGTFIAPLSVSEGGLATASFASPLDRPADLTAGLLYSYDFDNDGIFEITNSTAASATIPAGYLADGPFTRTLRGRISDKDGGFTDYTSRIAVTNVAPTVTLDNIPIGKTELQSVTVSASATDPSAADAAAGFTFAWTITKGIATIATGAGNSFTFTPGDNGAYTVLVTATDKDAGQSSAVTGALVISSVAPTATFSAPVTVTEGGAAAVSFSAAVDGVADLSAGLLYSYDFDNDGTFEITNSTAASATIPAGYLADGPFTRTVRGRISDKDGGFTDYTSSIGVTNVAPTVTLDAVPTGKTELQSVTMSASATDPSAADMAAGFTFAWTIRNGGSTIATGTGNSFTFTPGDNGTYTVSVIATDNDGGQSSAVTSALVISNVAPTATFSAPATVTEGATATASFAVPVDGSADLAAGLLYSYDFDNDGIFEITNSTAASVTLPATYLADGPLTRTVRGRVTDKDGGFTDYTANIAVTNAAPTVTLGPVPANLIEGSSCTVTASASDVSLADAAAGFVFAWTIRRGGGLVAIATGPSLTFTITAGSAYTVSVVAADKDGASASATTMVSVIAAAPPIDSTAPTAVLHDILALPSAGPTPYTLTVTYSDDTAIDAGSLDDHDVLVTGPKVFSHLAGFVSSTGTGTTVTATYSLAAPGGSWDDTDNGLYTITLQPNAVSDHSGNPAASAFLGSFTLALPNPNAPILVTQLGTGNAGSPDLTVAALSLKKPALVNGAIVGGTVVNGSVLLKNTGGSNATGNATVTLYLSADTTASTADRVLKILTVPLGSLKPNKTKSVDFTVTVPTDITGSRHIVAVVTPAETESDTLNNARASASFNVAAPETDLAAVSLKSKSGKSPTATLTIKNLGNKIFNQGMPVDLRFTDLGTGITTDLGTVTSPLSLKPGQLKALSLKVPLPISLAGHHGTLTALIDPADILGQSSTADDQAQVSI